MVYSLMYAHGNAKYVVITRKAVEEANANSVFPRMSRPDQRVVPTSLGYADGNFSQQEVAAWDNVCTRNGKVA